MFRKKRSASNPPIQRAPPGAAPSATSAAALAFLSKRASDANLSSSAAAAALRSHTASPEPVGAVQTRRMARRGSTSSYGGSPSGSVRQPFSSGHQRSSSSASMRDRTFRSPSPGGRMAPTPLPTVPDDAPPIPARSHKRTPSSENPLGAMSPRVSSPLTVNTRAPPTGSSMATTVRYDPNTRTVVRVPVQNRIQSGNPGSPRSVNFSRPMSPPLSHNSSARETVTARPATAQGFSSADSLRAQPPMPNTSHLAALRQQAKTTQTPAARARTPTSRPGSSVGFASGALTAASVAARPASVAGSPAYPVTAARAVPATARSPAAAQTRSVSNPISSGSAGSAPSTTSLPPSTRAARPAMTKGPSQEEIRLFQTRAAAMLARPLSDASTLAAPSTTASQTVSGSTKSVAASTTPASTASNPLKPAVGGLAPTRTKSVSPSRSAHFSQSPPADGLKHHPPSRDLSPAKSAMKAPSPRPSSPAGSSVYSDDGVASGHRKKKSVRVSFDAQPVLVGEASSPMTPASTTIMSPQYKKSPLDSLTTDNDEDYAPRPALPSFGSVRGQNSPNGEREASAVASTDPSQPSAAESTAASLSQPSSDLAAGSVLAQDFATKSNEAAPEHVPSISVLPATPRIDEENKTFAALGANDPGLQRDIEPTVIPESEEKSLPSAANEIPQSSAANPAVVRSVHDPPSEAEETTDQFTDAAEDQSDLEPEGGYASLDAIMESPAAETAAPQLPSSLDKSTLENTATTAAPPTESDDWDRVRKYWSSLSEQRKQELEQEAARTGAVSEDVPESGIMNGDAARAIPTDGTPTTAAGQPPLPPWPDQQYQQSVKPKTPAMKQTMRTPHQRTESEPSGMRTTMRDAPRPATAVAAPIAQPTPSQRPKSAIITTPASAASAKATAAQSASKKIAKPKLERTLSNESSASESSYRRKRRGSVASSEGGAAYSMKRTMRGAPVSPTAAARTVSPTPSQSSRFRFGGTRSPTNQPSMRGSVRSSVDSTTPTLRSNGFQSMDQRVSKQSTSKMGLGKSSRNPKPAQKSTSRFMSRFNDSSDEGEDDSPRQGFRSRFDDSDEEDAPRTFSSPPRLAPVRGIPRKAGHASGDSTDLDDSDDGGETRNAAAAAVIARSQLAATPSTPPNANGTAEGKVLQAGTLRAEPVPASSPSSPSQQTKHRRSFFGLGKKKSVVLGPQDASLPASPLASTASPKVTNTASPTAQSGTQGPNLLRRLSSSGEMQPQTTTTVTGNSPYTIPPIPPIPSLYSQPNASGTDRPNTSDGTSSTRMPTSLRPAMGGKRDSAMTAPLTSSATIVSERTGKKKKFQGLRRFLGVHN